MRVVVVARVLFFILPLVVKAALPPREGNASHPLYCHALVSRTGSSSDSDSDSTCSKVSTEVWNISKRLNDEGGGGGEDPKGVVRGGWCSFKNI